MILRDETNIVRILKGRQCSMRKEMDRRGITLKAVSFDSGIPYSSLLSYFPDEKAERDPALMPVSAQYALCGVIPEDILSQLLPEDRRIVRVPEALDHDEVSEKLQDWLREKERSHRPDSECGPAIGPNEDNVLKGKFAGLRSVA